MVIQEPQDLLIFSLGPVQNFIATARRTQDLWLGSQLLSNLALVGVECAQEEPAASLVYPRRVDGNWPQSVPNRFVASVPAGRGPVVGRSISNAVHEAWQATARQVHEFFTGLAPESGWQQAWDRQVPDWLETYWIAWHWDGKDYGTAYRRASLALDARKQVRHFPISAEPGETCTLCGLREALHGQRDSRRHVRVFWTLIRQDSRLSGVEVREGEQLCAICTVKRFSTHAGVRVGNRALTTERFASTSSIAATTFKAGLMSRWEELQRLAFDHLDALDALRAPAGAPYPKAEDSAFLREEARGKDGAERLLRYDGDFFYPESFALEQLADVLGREPSSRDERQAGEALRTLRTLRNAAMDLGIAPPHAYLAVLALDGDRMGQLLSESQSPAEHGAISDALVGFAQEEVPRIVEQEHGGRLLYAGGDDVLALLPVAHAFSAADRVRLSLSRVLRDAGWPNRTASAGIAIAHHTHPLESALRAARNAEHTAKEDYGRDALAIETLRRSGETTRVGLNWSYKEGVPDALKVVEEVRTLFATNVLSSKLPYDLRHEAPALAGVPAAHQAELGRLLRRHWQAKPVDAHRSAIEALAAQLAELCRKGRVEIEPLAEWLLVARFLAQGGQE